MNTAIIVAAGSGTRFNSEIPKQFVLLAGKPLVVHTIERFEAAESVDSIVLVLANERIAGFELLTEDLSFRKLKDVVPGGATRAESVRNGLNAVPAATEVVAVHDGARPLVSSKEIDATIEKAAATGAASGLGSALNPAAIKLKNKTVKAFKNVGMVRSCSLLVKN